MNDLLKKSPQELADFFVKNGIRRAYFVFDAEKNAVIPSHPKLEPLARFLEGDRRDFSQHEGIFLQVGSKVPVLQGAFIHSTRRGQAQGGTRFWYYDTVEDFLRDGLRLSLGMTRKNALAGLHWGGGKGVIAQNPQIDSKNPSVRASIFQDYGSFATSLRGCYITAEDVGTNTEDMANIFSQTRFTTCIPESLGGSGNPSTATALGVACGIEAALEFRGQNIRGKTIAVQGMGNVARPLIRALFEKGAGRIIACDIDADLIERTRAEFSNFKFETRLVERGDLSFLETPCDVLAPCATGAILNPKTIPRLKCDIVCGAANNQLEDSDRDDRALFDRGITYVPDFLVNRMGIVNCANEQYGCLENDPLITQHLGKDWEHSVHKMTIEVLRTSKESGESPARCANRLADKMALEEHPLMGHRGQKIIDSIVRSDWASSR